MAYSEASKRATYKYHGKKIKRVPLDMQIGDYEALKSAADAAGESVNGYIKRAIAERMEKQLAASRFVYSGQQAINVGGEVPVKVVKVAMEKEGR